MSFRKRSVPLSNATKGPPGRSNPGPADAEPATSPAVSLPGTRISPQFSLPTTSTGTASLDSLLGLGAGLALGTSLAIEEGGTTDYAGALLRCFAAEGVMQGHKVFVGAMEQWGATLPGLAEERGKKGTASASTQDAGPGAGAGAAERMKIAWRYERLGAVGAENERRGAWEPSRVFNAMQDSSVPTRDVLKSETAELLRLCRSITGHIGVNVNAILSYFRSDGSLKVSTFKSCDHIYPAIATGTVSRISACGTNIPIYCLQSIHASEAGSTVLALPALLPSPLR
jgi:PAXNEB protein